MEDTQKKDETPAPAVAPAVMNGVKPTEAREHPLGTTHHPSPTGEQVILRK